MPNVKKLRSVAKKALADFEEAVCLSLSDLESYGSRPLKTDCISQHLGLWNSSEIEMVRGVLNKLKADGRVENWGGNADNWRIR